jgi:hypothetical protein
MCEDRDKINMYDLNKAYIKSYNNKKEILSELNIKVPKFLNKNLNYRSDSYKNHIYRYDYNDNIKNPNLVISHKDNKIITSNPLSKYDRYNKNGAELCHAFKCRKHTKLISAFRGLFCPSHYEELSIIRKELNNAKLINNKYKEIEYRQKEFLLRKFLDKGHMKFMFKLETNIN